LLQCLTRQTEDEDEDEWTISKAAAVCLALFARKAKDSVVEIVKPFLAANFNNENWIFQDAAIQAFGSVLEGPSPETLRPIVQEGLPRFLEKVTDKNLTVEVRDTTAWVVASILEFCPDTLPPQLLNQLLEALVITLKHEPRVAVHSCYGISQLVEHVESQLQEDDPMTTFLSPFTQTLAGGLFETASREDADEVANGHELFTCAFTALGDLIRVSGQDMVPLLGQIVPVVLQKLAQTFQAPNPSSFITNVQAQCCGVLAELCRKLPVNTLLPHSSDMMQGFLKVFSVTSHEVHEEALMGIAGLARAMGEQFLQYMDHLKEPLNAALDNVEDRHVCEAAVGLVGDLSRALEKKFLPYCDDIMLRLLQLLMSEKLHRSVKPPILSTFADIALAVGSDFLRFLEHSMTMLYNASQIEISTDEEEDAEYLAKLHENILEGYSGIIQALRDADKNEHQGQPNCTVRLQPFLNNIVFLLEKKIAPDPNKDPSVLKAAINLLGDLAQALPMAKPQFAQCPWVGSLLNEASQNTEIDGEDVAFARSILQ